MKRYRMQGLTLVELMVSMVLGLVVVGGAVSLMLANRQSYRTNEGLSQVQESARTAFELLARDIRQAGVTGCDNEKPVANVLNPGNWWAEWFGIRGSDGLESVSTSAVGYGTDRGERIAGTDALRLQGMQGRGFSVAGHNTATSELTLAAGNPGDFVDGDVLVVCDFDQATIFQAQAAPSNVRITYSAGGAGVAPGNCSVGFGFPTVCSASGTAKVYGPDAQISRLAAVDWYIGNSGRVNEDGGRSLFRVRLDQGAVVRTEEVVGGVSDMQVTYRVDNDDEFVEADAITTAAEWGEVNAIRIALVVESADARVSTDPAENAGRLEREFVQVVTLRNRVP